MEKPLTKKEKKRSNTSLFKRKKKAVAPPLETPEQPDPVEVPAQNASPVVTPISSVISIQEAEHADTSLLVDPSNEPGPSNKPPGPSSASRPSSSRARTAGGRDAMLTSASMSSLRSREAWTDVEQTPTPSRQGSRMSVREPEAEPESKPVSKLFPADMNEAHAYVPYLYARDLIAKMMDDMKKMKSKHVTIVTDIENNYRNVEDKTQAQFNQFVLTLRHGYGNKVKTFRQVIEVHRQELSQKQNYWDEALHSLSDRNKALLEDKKKLLIHNKLEAERMEKEKEELKEELTKQLDEANKRWDTNNKDLIQRLEEKEAELDDLRRQLAERPLQTDPEVPAIVPVVAVTDLSAKEQTRMKQERGDIKQERQQIVEERKAIDRELTQMGAQKDDLQARLRDLQNQLNESNKERELWKTKYDELKRQFDAQGDVAAQYAQLQAQYEALASVAVPPPEKCEEALGKNEQDKKMIEEEKEKLKADVKKWEDDFKAKNNREPTEEEKGEPHKSLEEANEMIVKLEKQQESLEAMKQGEILPVPVAVSVPEPQVKIVEVRVPDPEVVAMLEMTQKELEAMRKAMRAMKNDKAALKDKISDLQGQVGEGEREVARAQAANSALQDRVRELEVVSADGGDGEELRRIIREKDKELREQELEYKDALRGAEKERKSLEKDLTRALKKLQKALKNQGDPAKEAHLNRLLQVVAAQVKDIHSTNSKASKEVENRLKEAEDKQEKMKMEQEAAKGDYGAWAEDWADQHGTPPKPADRDKSPEGQAAYEKKKTADWALDEADLLAQALALIAAGAVPEEGQEDEGQKAIVIKRRVPGQIVEEQEWEEVDVRVDEKITEYEEKIVYLEDKISDLESEKDAIVNNSKELKMDMKEQIEQHNLQVKEKEREHQSVMDKKNKEHQEEKTDMEKDIAKLVKLIDKLKKKIAKYENERGPQSAEDKAQEDLEDKLTDMETMVAELRAEKKQLETDNWELEEKVTQTERLLTTVETRTVELGAAAEAAAANAEQLELARDHNEQLHAKIRALEEELRQKEKELRDKQVEHEKELREKEREKKEMRNDIEKLVKHCDKLKHKINAQKGKGDGVTVSEVEGSVDELEEKLSDLEADRDHLQQANKELSGQVDELSKELAASEGRINELEAAAEAKAQLDATNNELQALRRTVKDLEAALRHSEKQLKDKDIEMRELKNEHERQMREKDRLEREMKADIKKLLKEIAKLKKKLMMREGRQTNEGPPDMTPLAEHEEDREQLEGEIAALEEQTRRLQDQVAELQGGHVEKDREIEALWDDNQKLSDKLESMATEVNRLRQEPVAAHVHAGGDTGSVQELVRQLAELQKAVDHAEGELREEKASHDLTREELEALKRQLQAARDQVASQEQQHKAALDRTKQEHEAENKSMRRKLEDAKKRAEDMEEQRLKGLPVDAQAEINKYKHRLTATEREKDSLELGAASHASQMRELKAKVAQLENSTRNQRSTHTDAENKLRKLRQEKDAEIKRLEAQMDRKVQQRQVQEQKKIAALEQTIKELKWTSGQGDKSGGGGGGGGADPRAIKVLQDKLERANHDKTDLNNRLNQLKGELRDALVARGSGAGGDTMKMKKLEKQMDEMNKKLEAEKKKNDKNAENLKQKDEDLKVLAKEVQVKDTELGRLRGELRNLGRTQKEAEEAATKAKELRAEVKKLTEENKTLSDNFNSERVLRKKYYNMVEDMKGKIRVFARARPLSEIERKNGNKNICNSPDEYTINVASSRGLKEFQFDQIFMPETSQEKVFEDTNNLIQSAVDGYNVCIFAYGQTGSGKTFTIIGDREQQNPGIAPRAFRRIFDLLDENKSKFSSKVQCYMLELYNDKLLDLFSKAGVPDERLEIKKDKKGMVLVQGAEVKAARNAKELMALFEEGARGRHTASHKMNMESSRSHLVIGILIESTNRMTGQITRGKLSLVDLAGSERAAKTGATAEQLKEAMSINKSLSALGDVISALSSEQAFVPYRNNKLTMLMQDSLGGNAKTLMFVNISPADYNGDETVISLTYASRVKLITNDAQKNADNKEIARLKAVVQKLRKGELIPEEEVEV